jgi:hypothetical protein
MPIVSTTRSSIQPSGAVQSSTSVTVTGVAVAEGGARAKSNAFAIVPPVHDWPTTRAEIQERVDGVVRDTESTLNRVAAVSDADLSFESVIAPLMSIAHYKTDKRVCEAKFLQHCSTDPELRAAAQAAGTTFAGIKAKSRTRDDVYARVKA